MVRAATERKRKSLTTNRARAKSMRNAPVSMERLFRNEVRDRKLGGFKFKRQVPIGRYIVDFVCAQRKLIVELDGPFHANAANYDERRDAYLQSCGYHVLRFNNNFAANDLAIVLSTVRHALSVDSPSP